MLYGLFACNTLEVLTTDTHHVSASAAWTAIRPWLYPSIDQPSMVVYAKEIDG
jgi:hypothetical protein